MAQEQYIEKLLTDMAAKDLPEGEQREMLEALQDRFSEVVLNVLVARLSPEQAEQVATSLDGGPEAADKLIEELATGIPGLREDMEAALAAEYEAISGAMRSGG